MWKPVAPSRQRCSQNSASIDGPSVAPHLGVHASFEAADIALDEDAGTGGRIDELASQLGDPPPVDFPEADPDDGEIDHRGAEFRKVEACILERDAGFVR